eukprot:scaffold113996_cov48-Prasinocladus_malaysianus.AAC.2
MSPGRMYEAVVRVFSMCCPSRSLAGNNVAASLPVSWSALTGLTELFVVPSVPSLHVDVGDSVGYLL